MNEEDERGARRESMADTMRSWSLKLGSLMGIDVSLHASFIALMAIVPFAVGADIALLVFAFFGCLAVHELGHAVTARALRLRVRGILLLPIGGVAQIDDLERYPIKELLVALAGPAVSLLVTAILGAVLYVEQRPASLWSLRTDGFAGRLMVANALLAAGNLLPALPLDGGRMLRALLSLWISPLESTLACRNLGRILAVTLAFVGLLLANVAVVVIAVFVYYGAEKELGLARAAAKPAGDADVESRVKAFSREDMEGLLGRGLEIKLERRRRDVRRPIGVKIKEARRTSRKKAEPPSDAKDVPFTVDE